MQNITFINNNNINANKNILNEMFKLRDETFKGRLGWEVNSKDGLEIDNFDRFNPSYITMNTFAKENDITDYVLVTTVACERILRQLGVTMRRMGDKKSMQIGVERSVSLWVEVDEKLNIKIN